MFANWAIFIDDLLPDDFNYWLTWGKQPSLNQYTWKHLQSFSVQLCDLIPGPIAEFRKLKGRDDQMWCKDSYLPSKVLDQDQLLF